jgi:hypothetical protein
MNIEELIHDLRARINPQYYDQIGTESYERHQVVKALEYLATENERLKELMAKRAREHQQEMTSFRLRVRSQDDATFAALREENERLRIEYIALRADAERIDWLADVNNTVGNVILPREIVESNIGSLRQAIDAARGGK